MFLTAFDESVTGFSRTGGFMLILLTAFDEPVTCFSRTGGSCRRTPWQIATYTRAGWQSPPSRTGGIMVSLHVQTLELVTLTSCSNQVNHNYNIY